MSSAQLSNTPSLGATDYYLSDGLMPTVSVDGVDQRNLNEQLCPPQISNATLYPHTTLYPTHIPAFRQRAVSESSLSIQTPHNTSYVPHSQFLVPPQSPKYQRTLSVGSIPNYTSGLIKLGDGARLTDSSDLTCSFALDDQPMMLDSQLFQGTNDNWQEPGYDSTQSMGFVEPPAPDDPSFDITPSSTATFSLPPTPLETLASGQYPHTEFQYPHAYIQAPTDTHYSQPTIENSPLYGQSQPCGSCICAPGPAPVSKTQHPTNYATGKLSGGGTESSSAQSQIITEYPVATHPVKSYCAKSVQTDPVPMRASSNPFRGRSRVRRANQAEQRVFRAPSFGAARSEAAPTIQTNPSRSPSRPNLPTNLPHHRSSLASLPTQHSHTTTSSTLYSTPSARTSDHSATWGPTHISAAPTPHPHTASLVPSFSQEFQTSQPTSGTSTSILPNDQNHTTESSSYCFPANHPPDPFTNDATATQSQSRVISESMINPQQQPAAEIAIPAPQHCPGPWPTCAVPTPEPRHLIPSDDLPQHSRTSSPYRLPNGKPRIPPVALLTAGRQSPNPYARSALSQMVQLPPARTLPPTNLLPTPNYNGGVAMTRDSPQECTIQQIESWLNFPAESQSEISPQRQVQSGDQHNDADRFPAQVVKKVESPALWEDVSLIQAPKLDPTLSRRQPSQLCHEQQRIQTDQICCGPSTPDERAIESTRSRSNKCNGRNREQHIPQVPLQGIALATEQDSMEGRPKAKRARSHGEWDNTPHKTKQQKMASNSDEVPIQMINSTPTSQLQRLSAASPDCEYFNADAWREGGSSYRSTRADIVAGANDESINAPTGSVGFTPYPPPDPTRNRAHLSNPIPIQHNTPVVPTASLIVNSSHITYGRAGKSFRAGAPNPKIAASSEPPQPGSNIARSFPPPRNRGNGHPA